MQNNNRRKTQHVLQTVTWLITTLNQEDVVKILKGYLHLYLLPVEHKKELLKSQSCSFTKNIHDDEHLVKILWEQYCKQSVDDVDCGFKL